MLIHEEYSSILEYLQKTYSKCFPVGNTPPLPLAVGIHKQLLASEELPFTKVKIRRFLKRYTTSKEYRRNLIVGNPRVDLNGNYWGTVTEEEIDQDYANTIIEGVKQNLVKIDEMISSSLKNWTIDRIPRVDRNILRLAVYELLFQKDVPVNVVISEAVNLAESLSTDDSASFVNATLATISKKLN